MAESGMWSQWVGTLPLVRGVKGQRNEEGLGKISCDRGGLGCGCGQKFGRTRQEAGKCRQCQRRQRPL